MISTGQVEVEKEEGQEEEEGEEEDFTQDIFGNIWRYFQLSQLEWGCSPL